MYRSLMLAASIALTAHAAGADTSWRCTTIETCEGLSCTPDNASFLIVERPDQRVAQIVLQEDGSVTVPYTGPSEGLLDDAPYSERRYVEGAGNARPTLVLVLSNPSERGVGVSVYWPGEDVATSREIIGRCVEL